MMIQPARYGVVVAAAVFFVGWITGMGGAIWPNVGFSLLMGFLAALLFAGILKIQGKGREK